MTLSVYLSGQQCENWWRPMWMDNRSMGWARGWHRGVQLHASEERVWLRRCLLWYTGPTNSCGSFCEYLHFALMQYEYKLVSDNIFMQNFIQKQWIQTVAPTVHFCQSHIITTIETMLNCSWLSTSSFSYKNHCISFIHPVSQFYSYVTLQ